MLARKQKGALVRFFRGWEQGPEWPLLAFTLQAEIYRISCRTSSLVKWRKGCSVWVLSQSKLREPSLACLSSVSISFPTQTRDIQNSWNQGLKIHCPIAWRNLSMACIYAWWGCGEVEKQEAHPSAPTECKEIFFFIITLLVFIATKNPPLSDYFQLPKQAQTKVSITPAGFTAHLETQASATSLCMETYPYRES